MLPVPAQFNEVPEGVEIVLLHSTFDGGCQQRVSCRLPVSFVFTDLLQYSEFRNSFSVSTNCWTWKQLCSQPILKPVISSGVAPCCIVCIPRKSFPKEPVEKATTKTRIRTAIAAKTIIFKGKPWPFFIFSLETAAPSGGKFRAVLFCKYLAVDLRITADIYAALLRVPTMQTFFVICKTIFVVDVNRIDLPAIS